jgi:hypothetical protein
LKTKRYVYAGAQKIAEESYAGVLTWSHVEPVTGSRGDSTSGGFYIPKAEFNADGINVGFSAPESTGFDTPEPIMPWGSLGRGSGCSVAYPNCTTCYLDGFEHDCAQVSWLMSIGGARQCPNNDCSPRLAPDAHGNPVLTPLTTNPKTGQLGYWPNGPTGLGLIPGTMGNPTFVTAWTSGHGEDVWQWVYDETSGKEVFVPVPTAYSGSEYFGDSPENAAPFDINGIRNGLQNALSKPRCGTLVNSLMNAVATRKNPLNSEFSQGGIMALFESVVSGKGGLTRNPVEGSAGYGSPSGSIAKGDAGIFVKGYPNLSPGEQLAADVKGVLGELMHHGGQNKYYTDRSFADIVHRDYPGQSRSIWPGDKSYKYYKEARKNDNHIGWSYYFHYLPNLRCF